MAAKSAMEVITRNPVEAIWGDGAQLFDVVITHAYYDGDSYNQAYIDDNGLYRTNMYAGGTALAISDGGLEVSIQGFDATAFASGLPVDIQNASIAVTIAADLGIDDTTPIKVDISEQSDGSPLSVSVSGDVSIDDTTPINVNLSSTGVDPLNVNIANQSDADPLNVLLSTINDGAPLQVELFTSGSQAIGAAAGNPLYVQEVTGGASAGTPVQTALNATGLTRKTGSDTTTIAWTAAGGALEVSSVLIGSNEAGYAIVKNDATVVARAYISAGNLNQLITWDPPVSVADTKKLTVEAYNTSLQVSEWSGSINAVQL